MNRLKAFLTAFVVMLGTAMAQTGTLPITASNIVDSTGTPLASGVAYFSPVDSSGNPISYHMGGRGQTLSIPVPATVTNGQFSTRLPDTSTTSPLNVCFSVSIIDNNTGQNVLGGGYSCLQPSSNATWCAGGTCNFDNYSPVITGNGIVYPATIALGTVTTGTPGSNASVSITGIPSAAVVNFTIPQGPIGPAGSITATGASGAFVANGQQVVGATATPTIQTAVTAAVSSVNSVLVPATVATGEMAYPATELTQTGVATSSYNNFGTDSVQDLRPLNHDVSLAQLINLPALDAEMEGGDTLRASKCAQAGACTVVLLGNSIHENINGVAPNDGYATGLLAALQRKFPTVTFTFENLSLGGTTVENFLDSSYLCETSGANTFYRTTPGNWYVEGGTTTTQLQWISGPPYNQWPSGCTIGQSWQQNVIAADPDIVIFGFVENDIGEGPGIFASHMQMAISSVQVQSGQPNRTVILTTDEPPNPNWYSLVAYDPALSESVNEAERGLAVQNSLLLADADRYYTVLTYGFDPARRHYQVENYYGSYPTGWTTAVGFSGLMPTITGSGSNSAKLTFAATDTAMVQRTRNSLDVTMTASFSSLTTSSVPSIWYRMGTNGDGYKVQTIVGISGSNSTYEVQLFYSASSAGTQTLVATGTCTFPTASSLSLTFSAVGAKHDVWCNTPSANNYAHIISVWDYQKLYAGSVSLGIQGGYGTIGNEYVYYGNPSQYFTPLTSIPSMLGTQVPPGFGGSYQGTGDFETNPYSYGGDGVHHPNAVGMDTYYLAAFRPVLDHLARSIESHSVYRVSHTGISSAPFGGIQDGQAGTVDFVAGPNGFRFVNNSGNVVIASGDNTTTNPLTFFKPISVSNPTINTGIVNGTGFQVVTVVGCATPTTFGGYCTVAVTLPVAEPDTLYKVMCSVSGTGGGGNPITLQFTTTGFNVHEFSNGVSGSTSDTVTCVVTH